MALGILWIRLLSNTCILKILDTLHLLYSSLVRTVWCLGTLKPFRWLCFSFSNRSLHFVYQKRHKSLEVWICFESLTPQTDWFLNLTTLRILHKTGRGHSIRKGPEGQTTWVLISWLKPDTHCLVPLASVYFIFQGVNQIQTSLCSVSRTPRKLMCNDQFMRTVGELPSRSDLLSLLGYFFLYHWNDSY